MTVSSGKMFEERPKRSWLGVISTYDPSSRGFESPNGLSLHTLEISKKVVWSSSGVSLESPTEWRMSFLTIPILLSAFPCLHGESGGEIFHSKLFELPNSRSARSMFTHQFPRIPLVLNDHSPRFLCRSWVYISATRKRTK